MDVDIKGDGRYDSSRRLAYKYSIDSWKKWCDKNNCDLFVLNELLMDNDEMGICWQRYYLFDILDANDINYNQILMVDADTIVHPDCPNFFEMTDGKLCGARFDGSWDWVLRGIENYSKFGFDEYMMPIEKYFDCGFMIVNKEHKQFFNDIIQFYSLSVGAKILSNLAKLNALNWLETRSRDLFWVRKKFFEIRQKLKKRTRFVWLFCPKNKLLSRILHKYHPIFI